MSKAEGKKGKYDDVTFEVEIEGLPMHRLVPVQLDKDGNPPPLYIPNITMHAEVKGAWSNHQTLLIGQCEWCGKHATGDPKSTPFICEDCATHPDRPPLILCSQCGERLTEVIGVSRKYFRCTPCKRELGR